jgi:hypothetical protein
MNALASAFALHSRPAPDNYRIEYRGTWVQGRAIRGSVKRILEGGAPAVSSLLINDNVSVLMILTEDETEIQVMEQRTAAKATFYTFIKEDGT